MASRIVTQGLQRDSVNCSQATGTGVTFDSARFVRSMAIDDGTVGFAAGHTALNSGGAITNFFAKAFDSSPTRTDQSVAHQTTYATTEGNFTIRRISLHDIVAGSVTASSTSLNAGVDGQSLVGNSDFQKRFILTKTHTNV